MATSQQVDAIHEVPEVYDEALKNAWTQFAVYDETAKQLKQDFITARQRVILLTAIASLAAITSSLAVPDSFGFVILLFGAVAITFPIIGSFLFRDAVQFVGETEWVHNRYIAERMRQQIYYYRTMTGDFYGMKPQDADDELAGKIRMIRDDVRGKIKLPPVVTVPQIQAKFDDCGKDGKEQYKRCKDLGGLSFAQYKKERVDDQISWYSHKVSDAFSRTKKYYRASQGALLIGSLIGAVAGVFNREVIVFIVITTAISETLISWSTVSLLGSTYSIFSLTAQKLTDMRADFSARLTFDPDDDSHDMKTAQNDFVSSVETILEWEREEWYEHVLRMQAEVDDRIMRQLDEYLDKDSESSSDQATASTT